ncbi:MAG: hypothetical protein HY955_03210, partial [Deltaproteobacteria bacterium]|nr:hypothetical protein [Deltaproteobacteria bacterium]
MAAKELLFSQSARSSILKGVNTLALREFLWHRGTGTNVLIEKSFGSPIIT